MLHTTSCLRSDTMREFRKVSSSLVLRSQQGPWRHRDMYEQVWNMVAEGREVGCAGEMGRLVFNHLEG